MSDDDDDPHNPIYWAMAVGAVAGFFAVLVIVMGAVFG